MDSRAARTTTVAYKADKNYSSWGYWEFAVGFGAYNREEQAWNEPLLDALMPEQTYKSDEQCQPRPEQFNQSDSLLISTENV